MESEPRMGESGVVQLATGVPGLDRLLNGGLRTGALHVLVGGPGAGKSVMAHQIGAHLIRGGGSVLYLTTLVETHQMLMSQARTFPFFDPSAVARAFYYASLYPALEAGGLGGVRDEIGRLVAHHAPTLLVIDGMHALRSTAPSRLDYPRFMHELEAQATVAGITTLVLAHPEGARSSDPTFTIADAVFHLRTRNLELRSVRMFRVEKLRGVKHLGGWHTFDIGGEGVHIYPRLEALVDGRHRHITAGSPVSPREEQLPGFHIAGLDEMVGGGLTPGSATLVVGTPGSGKTLAGLSFLSAGAEAGEPGLYLGFHEPPDTILEKAEGVGLPIARGVADGLLHLHWKSPTELNADAIAEQTLAMVDEHGIRRLVIDAFEDTRQAVIPRSREIPFHVAFTNLLRERGVTTVLLQDLPRIAGLSFEVPTPELPAMMENVLHLRYVEDRGELRRLVAVLKVRARRHDHALREFHITAEGMSVGRPFDKADRALTGFAHAG